MASTLYLTDVLHFSDGRAGMDIFWREDAALRFPLLVLILAIPIPAIIFNHITFPLQLLASRIASDILPLLGVPVLQEGNVIQLPVMKLEVAEACSGIRSLMSLFALAVFYGYFLERTTCRRTILAFASIPIAVAANVVRIVGTGLCVQYWDPDKALGFFHEFSGWVMFVISLGCLYLVHGVMRLIWPGPRTESMKSPRFWTVVLLLFVTALVLHSRGDTDRMVPREPLRICPRPSADGPGRICRWQRRSGGVWARATFSTGSTQVSTAMDVSQPPESSRGRPSDRRLYRLFPNPAHGAVHPFATELPARRGLDVRLPQVCDPDQRTGKTTR